MPNEVVWEMTQDVVDKYHYAYHRFVNHLMSPEEFQETMLALPKCPFTVWPEEGADIHLRIVIVPRKVIQVPAQRMVN